MSMNPSTEIRSFLSGRIGESFSDDDDIFALGYVNSLFAVQLVMHIEKTFGVQIPNEQLSLDNFRTVQSMSRLVERQLSTRAGA
jgi:methoxymalonate biosynthesis acyl carrier protein